MRITPVGGDVEPELLWSSGSQRPWAEKPGGGVSGHHNQEGHGAHGGVWGSLLGQGGRGGTGEGGGREGRDTQAILHALSDQGLLA